MTAACVVIRELPICALDERTLLGDGHRGFGELWYRTAVVEGEEAGFVVVDGPKIVKVGVLERFRRRGVGSALLVEAVERARRSGHDVCELYVRPDNDEAIRLYKRHDFRRAAVLREYYGPGQPAVRMERRLRAEDSRILNS